MKIEIKPFNDKMLDQSGALLAERHIRNRQHSILLPQRFEDIQLATQAVEKIWKKKRVNGFAAFRNEKMISYLIGEMATQEWGRCGYVYLPGYAIAQGESVEILKDMYALLGDVWNGNGCFNHYAYVADADTNVIASWFELGFGKERVDALLNLGSLEIPNIEMPKGIQIKRVVKGDDGYLMEMSDTIVRHQSRAPRWHPMLHENLDELAQGWAEIADTPTDMAYLALDGKEVLGSIAFYEKEEAIDDFTVPKKCTYMTVAATKDSARGRGIGRALTWHGLAEVKNAGFDYALTNWQSANLLAARFWPKFGYIPVAYRLGRKIDPSIAWGKG